MIGNTVEITVPQDIKTTYDWVVDVDAPIKFIHKTGPIPGFKSYTLLDGDWKHEGARRDVILEDGSGLTESIKTIKRPTYFDYTLANIQSPALSKLLARGFGQWWFTEIDGGGTHVKWHYAFEPTSPLLAPLVWLFMKTAYRNFMKAAMREMDYFSKTEDLKL